jgi:1-acyl-sn-glycerol-3-phosphate acyltransferase
VATAEKRLLIAQRLNYFWRVFATGLSFSVFGLGGATIPWLAAPIIKVTSRNALQRQRKARKLIQVVFALFIRMMRTLGILSWDVQGLDKLQASGQLILANHPTLLDVVFLVAFIPQADCIVKGRLRSSLASGGFIKLTGFIANDAGGEFIDNARRSITNGGSLIIFPEGTRSVPGSTRTFQRGAANLALRANIPITPVFIHCHPITLTKSHRWYHIPNSKFHLQFTVGERVDVTQYLDQPPSRAARVLTRNLEQHFNEELRPYE